MALTGTTLLMDANNATNTSFRSWSSNVSAKILASTLVKTGDTGQIDFTTVAAPGAGSTSMGYEIWRFDDSLQGTAPVFIKLEYGSGSAGASNPGVWLTIGSGSNGSGTLTGVLSTRQAIGGGNFGATNWYFCGAPNRLMVAGLAAGANAAGSSPLLFALERTVDANGNNTIEGVQFIYKAQSVWGQVGWGCTTGPMSVNEVTLGLMGPSVGFGSSGYATAVYPVFLTKGNFLNPGYNILGCYETNFSAGVPVTFSYYNVSHTYMPLTSAIASTPFSRGSAGSSVLVRYD